MQPLWCVKEAMRAAPGISASRSGQFIKPAACLCGRIRCVARAVRCTVLGRAPIPCGVHGAVQLSVVAGRHDRAARR